MHDFHYNVMKSVFEGPLHLLYTDTDSLLYEIKDCSDPKSEILAAGHGSHFDLSNFPQEHQLHDISCKRVPGAFKDECGGSMYISKFVGLHRKMYSLLFDNGSTQTRTESKVAKGVKSFVIQTSLAFNDYICYMLEDEVMEHSFKMIRSVAHDVHTLEQSKVSLSPFETNVTSSMQCIPFLMVIIDFPIMVAIQVEIELVLLSPLTHTHTYIHTDGGKMALIMDGRTVDNYAYSHRRSNYYGSRREREPKLFSHSFQFSHSSTLTLTVTHKDGYIIMYARKGTLYLSIT